ncbi:electron transport complex protein RnfC [Halolactibacillus halophilus]|uniref:Ion-translocating oxidoreductase complex subunit C n=1 Tax=Halolactibacillus halophilus TaxID=306540 RepID=A0A1I5MTC0_9BACI|nr:electron transport complex subunit RsxC [Halolactibacillus halophilus]GEM01241.1 electron transport complex subunit C [Halolactibacillus halophilus]SFP12216.1 electron transport complex protein RnfC [Halolactibacillus halophilus]
MLNMKLKYSRQGAYTEERKSRTEKKPIIKAPQSKTMIYPMNMHIGAPAEPIIEVGDDVNMGQLIAEKKGFVSANIYSSVSGTVEVIQEMMTMHGPHLAIVIKNDFKDTPAPALTSTQEDLTSQDKLSLIEQAGIAGMGGATFPTHVKLSPPKGKSIDTLIINGAECETYSTADHRLMIESAEEIVAGIKELLTLFPIKQTYIAIETNVHDSVAALKHAIGDDKRIQIKELETIYPQGAEKRLIKTLVNREVPSGGLPLDVHTIVANVSTVRAVYLAIQKGLPLMDRVTTVTGEPIKDPQNFRVRIGTPVQVLIDACGGFVEKTGKMLHGGPMMGKPITSGQVPITKGTSVISFLPKEEVKVDERTPCIKCAECLNVCPVNLQPVLISNAYEQGDIDAAERLGAMDCIDCGNCSYICPANIPLLDNIRQAKTEIKARKEQS